jgi:predicted Rossmann fold nucleotide-binding protein DprA/Smf involved in DNA uptake
MRPPERLHWKIISITGHRSLTSTDRAVVRKGIQALVNNKTIDALYFGGAKGVDTEAIKAALELRTDKKPWLTVVLPDTISDQPFETREWTRKADEVIELKNPITKDNKFASYRIRNQYLVDICKFLVAFFNGDYKSGTGQAVRMAEKVGLVVYKVPISGRDS